MNNSEWVNCDDRLPELALNVWRSARAYPVITRSVGLTYAYACITSSGHRYWLESHTMGNGRSDMCHTSQHARVEMEGVIQWMDIKPPVSDVGCVE